MDRNNLLAGRWRDNSGGPGDTGNGNPPGGNDLEARVAKLEGTIHEVQVRLVRIETRLDSMPSKSDISDLATGFHKSMNEQTWKIVGAITAVCGIALVVAKLLFPG